MNKITWAAGMLSIAAITWAPGLVAQTTPPPAPAPPAPVPAPPAPTPAPPAPAPAPVVPAPAIVPPAIPVTPVPGAPLTIGVPDTYVWDGYEYVGVIGDQYYYLGPGNVWLPMGPDRFHRFRDWEHDHHDWQKHAIRNQLYRRDAAGHDHPWHDHDFDHHDHDGH